MASRSPFTFSAVGGVLAAALCLLLSLAAKAEPLGPPPAPIKEWKTLAEYAAMSRDEPRYMIQRNHRAVMRQLAQTDMSRAECVSGLFDFDTETGQRQFYNIKGLLKAAAEKGLDWKAQQIVAHTIANDLCPPKKASRQ